MAEHLYTYIDPPSERDLKKACETLKSGGILSYPLGDNWGIGCDAANVKALDKIRRLKPLHPKEQPFSLICSDISMASSVGNIDHQMYRYLKKMWPGPYTAIVKRNRSLPRQIKDKRQAVGIKVPNSPLVLALIEAYGAPLATTSPPEKKDGGVFNMGYQIMEELGHSIDLILDLGQELSGLESTVVDFTEGYPVVLRQGTGDISLFG